MATDPWAAFNPVAPTTQNGPKWGPSPDPEKAEDQEMQRRDQALQETKDQRDAKKDSLIIEEKTKELAQGDQAKAIEGERKAAAFLIRALGSNESYETQGVGPRSYIGQKIADTAPDVLNMLPSVVGNSPERQIADTNQDEFIAASLRQDSGAAIPEEELERQRRIYFPMPNEDPRTVEAKRQARLRAIEGLRQSAGRLEDETQARYEAMVKAPPANPAPPNFSPADPEMAGNTSGVRNEDDPALAGVRAGYAQLLEKSTPPGQVIQWLRQRGVSDPEVLRTAAQQAAFRQKNPDVPIGNYAIDKVDDRVVPLSGMERTITEIGDNPVGAYLANAGQFLSGNTLDNLAANPERARAAMDVISTQNPNAAAVGQVSGGILGSLGGEVALARFGMAPGMLRGVAADSAMGAANGYGAADNGNRGMNALMGGITAGAGSAGGTMAVRGAANALAPTGGKMADLYAAGVRPTPGQRFADSGVIGRAVNATEEALQSVPVVGAAISGARQESRDQFQVGAFNQALREIGEELPKGMKPGRDPHKFAQDRFNDIYARARTGMRVVADEELSNDLAGLSGDIATLGPQAKGKLKAIMANSVNSKLVDGELSGPAYKKAHSDLGKHIARLRKSSMAEDQALADVLEGTQGAIDGAARRHSDPDAVKLLDAADAGYAKLVRIEEAAMKRGGDDGTFTPAQFDSAVQKSSGGVRSKAYLRGDALMQDYANAGKGLSDRLPNSGTADRAVATGLVGGLGYVEPVTLTAFGAIASAYAPGVRKVAKGAMAPAGPSRRAIAAQIKKIDRLTGRAGAAAATTGALAGPE